MSECTVLFPVVNNAIHGLVYDEEKGYIWFMVLEVQFIRTACGDIFTERILGC